MDSEIKTYLATEIVSEQKTISYRNVARALKVHVNAAKCLLYEFYTAENKKKSGSIYATYLLAGVKKDQHPTIVINGVGDVNGNHQDPEEDHILPSSPPPYPSSMIDPSQDDIKTEAEDVFRVPVRTISLVREEHLENVKDQFEKITSIHIYSLSSTRLPDLVTLTDVGRGLFTDHFVKNDPLTHNKIYGVIQNPEVRRRKGKRPVIPETAPSKFTAVKTESKTAPAATSTATATTIKKEEQQSSRESTPSIKSKPATLKRDASDLFKAFAKSKTKPKLEKQDTDASNASGSGVEDTKMVDVDDEGVSDDDALFLDTGTRKSGTRKRGSDVQKEREDKSAKLRKLVESDDEDEPAVPNVESASRIKDPPVTAMNGDNQKPSNTTNATKEEEDEATADWSDSDTENQRRQSAIGKDPRSKNQPEPETDSQPKRRRGKRKVTKKRTTKDEDGYLVTKEETVWESYSEDEPDPIPAAKANSNATQKSAAKNPASSGAGPAQSQKSSGTQQPAGAKGKKKAGDIMSFFGKKAS